MKLKDYKGRKVPAGFLKKKSWFGKIREKASILAQRSDTVIFFSKRALTIFLVFGLKLVLNMTFNLSETYFPGKKIAIWRYLTLKSSKFGCFLILCIAYAKIWYSNIYHSFLIKFYQKDWVVYRDQMFYYFWNS